MITQSGVHIQKIGGADGTPTPQDIAIHSGRICRFGGAVWYPLLPHLIFVGVMAYRRSFAKYNNNRDQIHKATVNFIWGLLHDAHEVVTCDVPRPFKCDCMKREQNAIDNRLLTAFFNPMTEDLIDYDLIKECDHDAADIEATYFDINGYAKAELSSNAYNRTREKIHNDPYDMKLFAQIMAGVFNRDTISAQSVGVQLFANLLQDIQNQKDAEDFSRLHMFSIFHATGVL